MQSTHFSWTLFDYESHIDDIRLWVDTHDSITYVCFGHEICPNTGRPHLQGYLQTISRTRWPTLKRKVGIDSLHLEASKGSDEQNRKYCQKTREQDSQPNEVFEEFGVRREIGASNGKSNLANDEQYALVMKDIREGMSCQSLAEKYPVMWLKHYGAIEKSVKMFNKKTPRLYLGPFNFYIVPDWEYVQILVGPSGIGKTQFAKTLFPNPLLIRHVDKLKLYNDNYHGGIIFDDMQFTHWPESSQIHICDVTDDSDINVKHSIVTIPAGTKRVMTCNDDRIPVNLMDPAIRRRCQVWKYKKNDIYPLGQFYLQ